MTNPDPAIERLLRETLARSGTSSRERTDECLDAETLAAWTDGALDSRARAAAEAHAAGCVHCQAMLAAMARTEPPVAERSWLAFPALKWLVPVTAAAAALAIWVAVPDGRNSERSTLQAPATSASSASSPGPAATVAAPPPTDATAPSAVATPPPASRVDSFAAAAADRNRQRERKADAGDHRVRVGGTEFQGRTVPPEADVAAAAPPNPAAAPPAPPPPASPTAPLVAPQSAPMAAARMERALVDAVEIVVPSPDANVRWRILPNRAEVQRSVDGGATWSNQNLGIAAVLSGGASPAPSVCWVVGARGTVLLTTDGATWRTLAFPEPIDLMSVRATDDRTAIVTAADGRRFATADGGLTWTRPPAQENPPAPF